MLYTAPRLSLNQCVRTPSHILPHHILSVQMLAAAAALGGALVFQYVLHLPPCHFCLWQRYPYGAVLAVGLLAMGLKARGLNAVGYRRGSGEAVVVNSGLFLLSAGIAMFHSGIERGWWTSGSGCTAAIAGGTPEEVLAALLAAPVVRCDEIPWQLLGLSLANLNVIYGLSVMAGSMWVVRRIKYLL
jgi:disulfide bond formation protein DsbB